MQNSRIPQVLSAGSHSKSDGACLLEVVSLMQGQVKTDWPSCVLPTLITIGQRMNDAIETDDERTELLLPYAAKLANTRPGTTGKLCFAEARVQIATVEWYYRTVLPLWCEFAGEAGFATRLRTLPDVVDGGQLHADVAAVMSQLYGAVAYSLQDAARRLSSDYAEAIAWLSLRGTARVSGCTGILTHCCRQLWQLTGTQSLEAMPYVSDATEEAELCRMRNATTWLAVDSNMPMLLIAKHAVANGETSKQYVTAVTAGEWPTGELRAASRAVWQTYPALLDKLLAAVASTT